MIRLHPYPESHHKCPHCGVTLEVRDWYIPGMRMLAELQCPLCRREYYGDLLAGHGLIYPMLLDKHTGDVNDPLGVSWFADCLHASYANRKSEPLDFIEEKYRALENPLLLNCLDTLYGHSLLKLLNAQYYLDHEPDVDLVVLVPKFLRWMVPDGVAAIWTVDLPLKRGIEWNDWLGAELHRRLDSLTHCSLSVAYSHPHPKFFSIERFTRVRPFPLDEWELRMEKPMVTFIWRDDRPWESSRILTRIFRWPNRIIKGISRYLQTRRVKRLASRLQKAFPNLDFAVAGLGTTGDMPDWIRDLRTTEVDASVEKRWCERYASSHLVIGVHGSNMLLPSAHAGATIDLMPYRRWGNMIQDLLMADLDCREALYRYHIIPISTTVRDSADLITTLFRSRFSMEQNFNLSSLDHESANFAEIHESRLRQKSRLPDK